MNQYESTQMLIEYLDPPTIKSALMQRSASSESPTAVIQLTTVTPKDAQERLANSVMRYGFANSPYGECLIAQSDETICHLSFFDASSRDNELEALKEHWSGVSFLRDDPIVVATANYIFSETLTLQDQPPLQVLVSGTKFQQRVWQSLLQIPAGQLITYSRLAEMAGHPTAHRAAASAVAKNCVGYLIPCHRVVRSTGVIGQYRWGTERKHAMIARELGLNMPYN
ncbi:MAG: methylated-DNA--[protein]-cysteine S-methyltransferase [Planctomycetota bacterium]